MTTDRKLKTLASINPECDSEMVSVVSSIDEYSRTFEMMTGRQLGDPMPENISDNTKRELNMIANRIESSTKSLCECMRNKKYNKK